MIKQNDPSAKVRDLLIQEPYYSMIQNSYLSEVDIEQQVLQKVLAEEESSEIQHMIAQFYNKFDELHEQSLTAALSKSPNKEMIKNEVKYRIPERWTKKFHKEDIVSAELMNANVIPEERGNINKTGTLNQREQFAFTREQSLKNQISGNAPINNPILHHSLSSKNYNDGQESSQVLSSNEQKTPHAGGRQGGLYDE